MYPLVLQPSVRKQHNAGYKHKQYEAQQNQYLIDQKVKEHLGQAVTFQQVGAAYNQLRPRLSVLPNPMMPMPGNPQLAINPSLFGMMPPVSLPIPIPDTLANYASFIFLRYPGMPPMVVPPGAPSMVGQVNPSMAGQVNNDAPRPIMVNAPISSLPTGDFFARSNFGFLDIIPLVVERSTGYEGNRKKAEYFEDNEKF
ncbi:hypothetical protein L6452_43306 [Arctium lappa]|uniref:Uncharacterized protein n=1 Tax=Arctium lappa TaxID=4217 RepID=A0ACB8XL92_ARCLA|nr:hypothetical protein L6452_43306 [Arctium lappa]